MARVYITLVGLLRFNEFVQLILSLLKYRILFMCRGMDEIFVYTFTLVNISTK